MGYARARSADFTEIPVIDMAPLADGGTGGLGAVGQAISEAAIDVGFFYVRNHGIARETLAGAYEAARRFFALPEDVKRQTGLTRLHRGYIAPGKARMYGKAPPDLKESFVFGLDLNLDDPDVQAGKPLMGPNSWPAEPPGFKDAIDAWFEATCRCGNQLTRAVAVALGLQPTFFAQGFAKPLARGSIIHYPPQPPDLGIDRFGVAPHSDYGCLTLLWQDMVGGLQVRNRAGDWILAPPLDGALVINIGDLLARWTNDSFASTPHRVVNASGRERYSMAVFYDPHPDTEIAVLPGCVAPGDTAHYGQTTCGAYLLERFGEAFAYGKG